MDTLTTNVPLAYAVIHDGEVHLFVVVFAGSSPTFNTPGNSGSTKLFPITAGGSPGNTAFFKKYPTFSASSFTDIKISCNGHVNHLLVEDLDEGELPDVSNEKAFEVPYVYTQIQGLHNFKSEFVIFADQAKKFDHQNVPVDPNDPDQNTKTEIFINQAVTSRTAYSKISTFAASDVLQTDGAHDVEYTFGDPPKQRRHRLKNRNHSQTPFPKKRRNRNT